MARRRCCRDVLGKQPGVFSIGDRVLVPFGAGAGVGAVVFVYEDSEHFGVMVDGFTYSVGCNKVLGAGTFHASALKHVEP